MRYPDEPRTKVITAEDSEVLERLLKNEKVYVPVSVTTHGGALVCVLTHQDCK